MSPIEDFTITWGSQRELYGDMNIHVRLNKLNDFDRHNGAVKETETIIFNAFNDFLNENPGLGATIHGYKLEVK